VKEQQDRSSENQPALAFARTRADCVPYRRRAHHPPHGSFRRAIAVEKASVKERTKRLLVQIAELMKGVREADPASRAERPFPIGYSLGLPERASLQ